jgi:hypothetical protein
MIYALRSIAWDADRFGITVDYSITVEEVYHKIALKFLREGNHLSIISEAFGPRNILLPSWVPD